MEHVIIILKIALITGLGLVLYQFLQGVTHRLHQKELLPHSLFVPVKGIIKWLLVIFITLLVLQQLGISISRVVAALSAVLVLVAVGFVAFWSVLTNILSCFLLVIFSPFRVGDVIEIRDPEKEKGTIGKVVDLNIFYTTLLDLNGSKDEPPQIRIPNSLFFQRIIICHKGDDTKSLKQAINKDVTTNMGNRH